MAGFEWICVTVASFDYPVLRREWFDEWPSFTWELPLFWWFMGIAIALGIVLAVIFRAVQSKERSMSFLSIAPVLSLSMVGREKSQGTASAGSTASS